jgi:hypothetical protein
MGGISSEHSGTLGQILTGSDPCVGLPLPSSAGRCDAQLGWLLCHLWLCRHARGIDYGKGWVYEGAAISRDSGEERFGLVEHCGNP